ncbi:MAG: YjjG family noncanonical pyrimidine nucleotidase [Clostridia bacterium]|nr:YjjG family noncanonical pyrimidine nucleotidase [Clostridia bacterium]
MTFSTLLMDADDTIFDFPKCEYNALKETITKNGLTFTDETHQIFSKINNSLWKKFEINKITRSELKIQRFRQLAQACFRDFPNPDILADTYINELAKQPVLIDGAFEALQKLTQKFDVYIITNVLSKVQRGRFGKSPITPLVKDIFISDEMGVNKPSKEYFDKVLAQISEKDTSKILVVGDSLTSDMQGGKNAGLMTCIYDPKNKITLPHPLCDFKVTDLNDILQFAE